MDTIIESTSSNEEFSAQTAAREATSGNVHDAAQQLQAAVSRLAEGFERNQENLTTLIKQMSEYIRATDAENQKNGAQIERLGNWIRNNRT